MHTMTSLVPMWIPTLIYGIGTAIMLFFMVRDWRKRDREYQRGYDSGVADTIRSRISIQWAQVGPASTQMKLSHWVEVNTEDDEKTH